MEYMLKLKKNFLLTTSVYCYLFSYAHTYGCLAYFREPIKKCIYYTRYIGTRCITQQAKHVKDNNNTFSLMRTHVHRDCTYIGTYLALLYICL